MDNKFKLLTLSALAYILTRVYAFDSLNDEGKEKLTKEVSFLMGQINEYCNKLYMKTKIEERNN